MLKSLIAFFRRLLGLDALPRAAVAMDTLPTVALVQLLDVTANFPPRPFVTEEAVDPDAAFEADNSLGMVHHFAGRFETTGWNCDGRSVTVPASGHLRDLFALIGHIYGGGGNQSYPIPDLRGTIPLGTDVVQAVGARDGTNHTMKMNWVICVDGSIAPNTPTVGMLALISGNYVPQGWMACNGQSLQVARYRLLSLAIGTVFGGDGTTSFALPDLRGRTPVGIGTAADGTVVTMGQKLDGGAVKGLGLNIVISTLGDYPQSGTGDFSDTSLLGEVRVLAFAQPVLEEDWWVPCDGRTLSVEVDPALFTVIGSTYGGDGTATYKLPDLRGCAMTGTTLS